MFTHVSTLSELYLEGEVGALRGDKVWSGENDGGNHYRDPVNAKANQYCRGLWEFNPHTSTSLHTLTVKA